MKISSVSTVYLTNQYQPKNQQKMSVNFSAKNNIPRKIITADKMKLPKVVEKTKIIKELNIPNYRMVNSTSISGGTFSNRSILDLSELKSCGIETIIDFRGEAQQSFADSCKRLGLNYFNFNLNNVINMTNPEYFIPKKNERTMISDKFVSKLKDFFDLVNRGNAYIGCQFGVDRTNVGLVLNYLMNPKTETAPTILTWPYEKKKMIANKNIKVVKKIIKRLTPEQKQYLGIPEDYSSILQERIYRLLDKNGLL